MNTAAHCDLARWWGVPIAGERDLPALKDAFTRRGLDRRAWRLYPDYGDTRFAPSSLGGWVTTAVFHPERRASYLALLQALESDLPPQAGLCRRCSTGTSGGPPRALPPPVQGGLEAPPWRVARRCRRGAGWRRSPPLARWFINEARLA